MCSSQTILGLLGITGKSRKRGEIFIVFLLLIFVILCQVSVAQVLNDVERTSQAKKILGLASKIIDPSDSVEKIQTIFFSTRGTSFLRSEARNIDGRNHSTEVRGESVTKYFVEVPNLIRIERSLSQSNAGTDFKVDLENFVIANGEKKCRTKWKPS